MLGTGDSGKSTIVKQMKLLHPNNNRAECGFNLRGKILNIKGIISSSVKINIALLYFV